MHRGARTPIPYGIGGCSAPNGSDGQTGDSSPRVADSPETDDDGLLPAGPDGWSLALDALIDRHRRMDCLLQLALGGDTQAAEEWLAEYAELAETRQ